MQFLKSVLATVVGLFLFGFIFFILIIVIGVAAAAAGSGGGGDKNLVEVKDNSVIELDLTKVSNDYAGNFIYKDFAMLNSEPKEGLTDVLNAIDAAKSDDRIKGITITNGKSGLGMAQNKALRDKLEEFKKSKKFIVAYSDTYSQGSYYLNSVADTLYLNPVATLNLKACRAK